MRAYHDEEWGVPERDSRALWEKLMLDGFQAGLAWITILRKRDAFREAFEGFDPEIVATFGEADVERLLEDARIMRSLVTRSRRRSAMRRPISRCAMRARISRSSSGAWRADKPIIGDGV